MVAARWPVVFVLVCLLLAWNGTGLAGRSLWYSRVGGQMKEAQVTKAAQQGGEEPWQTVSLRLGWQYPSGWDVGDTWR